MKHKDLGICSDLQVIDRLLTVEGAFLVDAGCGNMGLSKALAHRGARVLGIDPDPVQAGINHQAERVENVEFAQTGAQSMPVDDASVDGVIFPYSLHHVPAGLYPAVFEEVFRVLKSDAFLYVMEPVAAGHLNEVMRLFHDEHKVRREAQEALEQLAIPRFSEVTVAEYRIPIQYESWEEYADRYVSKSYNTNYTEAQVRAEPVRQRFLELGEASGFRFETPMRVTFCRHPRA